jgi:hypothetical protein
MENTCQSELVNDDNCKGVSQRHIGLKFGVSQKAIQKLNIYGFKLNDWI